MTSKRYLGNIITDTPTDPTGNSGANYGVATGVWSLSEARTFSAAGSWPIPASAPGAPTIGTATAGNATATVPFTPNADDGGLDVTSFTATSNPGSITGSASSSPITVTGLTNGTAYTFTVTATNAAGTSAASSASNSVTPEVPQRGLFAGGESSGGLQTNTIQYITITSTGNATDFGDLDQSLSKAGSGCASSATRALFAAGRNSSSNLSRINYVSIFSTGNAADFGDVTSSRYTLGQLSSSTRAVFGGGVGNQTRIDYVTIASTGNATTFGSLTGSKYEICGVASPTRGLFAGSSAAAIDYITIASTGNASDFGDLINGYAPRSPAAASNGTRAVFAGDHDFSYVDTMQYVTIATTGNATDFGDQSQGRGRMGGVASPVRGVYAGGGRVSGNAVNIMDYITIASTGNATDFGDLLSTYSEFMSSGASGHGGIS